jgi:hypothetical protein
MSFNADLLESFSAFPTTITTHCTESCYPLTTSNFAQSESSKPCTHPVLLNTFLQRLCVCENDLDVRSPTQLMNPPNRRASGITVRNHTLQARERRQLARLPSIPQHFPAQLNLANLSNVLPHNLPQLPNIKHINVERIQLERQHPRLSVHLAAHEFQAAELV